MCVSGWVMRHREAVVIPDIYQDSRVPQAAYRPTFVKSLVMVPIRRLDPIGAIGNYWARQREPSDSQVDLLRALADSTSIAIENVEVYRELERRVQERTSELREANEEIRLLSVTDELTGVSNRRGFYLLAESALRLARRGGHDCLLAFLDVDGLKRVNDEHGHDVGDALIADVAKILREVLRASDIVARIGGDEFCVLVTESSGDRTTLRRRLCEAFDSFNESQHRPYVLSASIGLVEFHGSDIRSLDEIIACADKAMYEEKKAKTAFELG